MISKCVATRIAFSVRLASIALFCACLIILPSTTPALAADALPEFRPDPKYWTKEAVPIYSSPSAAEDQIPGSELGFIPAGTEIHTSVINKSGLPWSKWGPHDKPRKPLIASEIRGTWATERATGVLATESKALKRNKNGKEALELTRGFIPRENLTSIRPKTDVVKNTFTPTTENTARTQLCWAMPGFMNNGKCQTGKPLCESGSRRENVLRLMREFHNTRCDRIHDAIKGKRDLREVLINAWSDFVESKKTSDDYQWAKMAEEADILTRTVLHEAHPPGELAKDKPGSESCEWMLIAQAIQNRRHECTGDDKNLARGCRKGKKDDLIGVATQPTEINIWHTRHVLNSSITSCFLRDDLQNAQESDLRDSTGQKLSSDDASSYTPFLRAFPRALNATMRVLGFDETAPAGESEEERRLRLFEVTNIDNETTLPIGAKDSQGGSSAMSSTVSSGEVQKLALKYLNSYYHPQAMPACNPKQWNHLHFARSADIRCDAEKNQRRRYIPLIRDRVELLDEKNQPLNFDEVQSLSQKFKRNTSAEDAAFVRFRLRHSSKEMIDGEKICKGARLSLNEFVEPNEAFACLPGGVYPQCPEAAQIKNPSEGRQISINLMSPELLKATAGKMGPGFVSNSQIDWNRSATRLVNRRTVGVRCRQPTDLPPGQSQPEFRGLCDGRMTTITELPR